MQYRITDMVAMIWLLNAYCRYVISYFFYRFNRLPNKLPINNLLNGCEV